MERTALIAAENLTAVKRDARLAEQTCKQYRESIYRLDSRFTQCYETKLPLLTDMLQNMPACSGDKPLLCTNVTQSAVVKQQTFKIKRQLKALTTSIHFADQVEHALTLQPDALHGPALCPAEDPYQLVPMGWYVDSLPAAWYPFVEALEGDYSPSDGCTMIQPIAIFLLVRDKMLYHCRDELPSGQWSALEQHSQLWPQDLMKSVIASCSSLLEKRRQQNPQKRKAPTACVSADESADESDGEADTPPPPQVEGADKAFNASKAPKREHTAADAPKVLPAAAAADVFKRLEHNAEVLRTLEATVKEQASQIHAFQQMIKSCRAANIPFPRGEPNAEQALEQTKQ